MEIIGEILGYILVDIIFTIVLIYPGATVLWLLSKRAQKINEIIKKKRALCYFFGILIFVFGITIIYILV